MASLILFSEVISFSALKIIFSAILSGIITMPSSIIDKISLFGKSYEALTLDTVKKFLKDSRTSNFKI